jgi:hypothetical protein
LYNSAADFMMHVMNIIANTLRWYCVALLATASITCTVLTVTAVLSTVSLICPKFTRRDTLKYKNNESKSSYGTVMLKGQVEIGKKGKFFVWN